MKIIFLTYDFHPPIGGQGVEAIGLYHALKEKNMNPVIVCPRSYGLIADGSLKSQIKYNILTNTHLSSISKASTSCVVQIYGGPGGVILLRKPDKKVRTIILANHTYAQQRRWRKGVIRNLLYRLAILLETRAYKNADTIISISRDTKESLQKDYKIESSKITVIPVGIDFSDFRKKINSSPDNSILFVGRLHWRKDPLTLIKAFQIVKEKIEHVKLHIVGTGPLDDSLKKYVSMKSIKEVTFWGKVSQEQLEVLYSSSTVMAIPSHFEGLGIVAIEAMAHGIPTIASNALGLREVVMDGHTGFLFEVGNHEELAQKLMEVISNKSLHDAMSRKAIQIAYEKYNWSTIAIKFLSEYNKILGI